MPKKTPRNSFYYFMIELKTREERLGRTFTGMSEVANEAGPEWQKLTPAEKRPYEIKAKDMKHSGRVIKYTSLGEDVEVVTKRAQAVADAQKNMELYIERLVSNGIEYESKEFLVASVNHYCYCMSQSYNRHIPAELSIVRFSLRTGINLNNIYHAIYDLDQLPMGYFLAAKKTSEESHQIPLPPHEESFCDVSIKHSRATFDSLLKFMMANSDNVIPPVYVDLTEMDMAKDVFKHFLIENGYDDDAIRVFSLPYLFFVLRNAARVKIGQEPAFPYASIADSEFERDIYDYVKGISCEYHTITEAYPYCTMSKAIRKIYLICDHCCGDLNIPLVPGLHVPKSANIKKLTKPATTTAATPQATIVRPPEPQSPIKPPPLSISYSDKMKGLKITSTPISSTSSDVFEEASAVAKPASMNESGSSKIRRPFSSSNVMKEKLSEPSQPSCIGRGRGRIV